MLIARADHRCDGWSGKGAKKHGSLASFTFRNIVIVAIIVVVGRRSRRGCKDLSEHDERNSRLVSHGRTLIRLGGSIPSLQRVLTILRFWLLRIAIAIAITD